MLTSSGTILSENMFPNFYEGLSLSYLRFIDDIFFIWTGNKDQLITFLNDLHTNHNSIKFGHKELQSNISFPDTKFYIKSNKVETKIYRKGIKRQIFLHVISEHPILLKNSIPLSQVLREKRRCLTSENFRLCCLELKQKLIEKRNKSDLLDKHTSRVEKLERN